jgi:methylmalonyl-CoA mutase cobalamin-binding subunit
VAVAVATISSTHGDHVVVVPEMVQELAAAHLTVVQYRPQQAAQIEAVAVVVQVIQRLIQAAQVVLELLSLNTNTNHRD